MPIPTEARATLDALAEGYTPQEYRDAIWRRRDAYQFARDQIKIDWSIKRIKKKHLSLVANQA